MHKKTVLPNGVRIISEEIDHVRSISIGVWVLSGSRYEDNTTNGTAHFIEHMLFKGTESRSAFEIASAIDSVGGMMNAFTGKELTSFYIKIPDYHLSMAIDLLADIFIKLVTISAACSLAAPLAGLTDGHCAFLFLWHQKSPPLGVASVQDAVKN